MSPRNSAATPAQRAERLLCAMHVSAPTTPTLAWNSQRPELQADRAYREHPLLQRTN